MGDVIRSCFSFVVERKLHDQEMYARVLPLMHSKGLLSTANATRGVIAFLEDLDEIVIDAPMAGKHCSYLVSYMVISGVLDGLNFLSELPEDSMFRDSPQYTEFVAQFLSNVSEQVNQPSVELAAPITALKSKLELSPECSGLECAKALYTANGLKTVLLENITKFIAAPKEDSMDVLTRISTKYALGFLPE